jgi:hypothetical protein
MLRPTGSKREYIVAPGLFYVSFNKNKFTTLFIIKWNGLKGYN